MFLKKRHILFVSGLLFLAFVTAEIFQDVNSTDFNNGQYNGTIYNSTGIVLNGSNLNGEYTSRIFDSGFEFIRWNNITIEHSIPNSSILISADAQSDVWNSTNFGVNWSEIKSDYNGAEGNGADDIGVNKTNSIFLMNSQHIWVTNNKGGNWTNVNADFNGGDSSSGLAMTIDANNTIFAVDGAEGVWASYNSGLNFTNVNISFNSGGQNPTRMTSNSSLGLFITDAQSKIWASSDQGRTWTNVNADFNGAGNSNEGADGMRVNSSDSIFIVDRQKLWVSVNSGLNWTNVNADFNGGVGSNAFSMNIDERNDIYIIDGNQDVYLSTNQGVSFAKISDNFNGGNGAIRAFHLVVSLSNVAYQVRNCTLSCTNELYFGPDGTTNTYYSNITSSFNLGGRYFQYKITFNRTDTSVMPIAYNSSIDYSILNSAPNISLIYPLTGNYSSLQTFINYTVSDTNLDSCWYSLDSGVSNISIVSCGTNITGLSSLQGTNIWTVYANDTVNALSLSNVTFFVDSLNPGISFNEFTFSSGNAINNHSFRIGITVNDTNFANVTIFLFNSTGLISSNTSSLNLFNITYSGLMDGVYFYNASSRDLFNNYNFTETRNLSIDTTAPQIEIFSPSEGSAFGYNISIALNYSVNDSNLDSCWYRFDSEINNITLTNCNNILFNISDGNHIVYLFANDTVGNIASESNSFYVQVGAPTITVNSPINSYLNYSSNVAINYTATDFDLNSCSLFLSPNGSIQQVTTTNNPSNGTTSTFFANLTDNSYMWAISCNDTAGHMATTGNSTFYIDTIRPSVTLNAPSGAYTSLSNIPLTLSVSDASPVQCMYNITFAASGNVVVGNSELLNCASTTFTLDTESSYFLNLLVNDSAGNVNITRNSFTVSIPTGGGGSGGSPGGGGGSGRGGIVSGLNSFSLSLGDIDTLKIGRGESESVELPVTNKGLRFLNDCHFFAKGGVSNWISGEDIQSLSPGQTVNYIFSVNVPIDAEVGEYFVTLGANCVETNATFTYNIDVTGGEFEITILNSERIGTKLKVEYAIENFGDKTKNIKVNYKILNSKRDLVVDGSVEPVEVLPGQRFEGIAEFELPKNSIGDYLLVIEATDGLDVAQKEQDVRFTARGISGFAVSEDNLKTIGWFALVVLLSFGIYIVLKTIKHQIALRKANNIDRQFITIDLNN